MSAALNDNQKSYSLREMGSTWASVQTARANNLLTQDTLQWEL